MKRIVTAVLTLLVIAAVSTAGNDDIRRYVLFAGDTDSTVQSSRWIDIVGAQRVYIRTFSTHAGFGANADSTKSDSIATFKILLTDSANVYNHLAAGADSVQLSGVSVVDSVKQIALMGGPVNKQLRGAGNGWGLWCKVYPTGANGNVALSPDEVIGVDYMRVQVTPLRRATAATGLATVPNRVNGLRGLRMYAEIYKRNR